MEKFSQKVDKIKSNVRPEACLLTAAAIILSVVKGKKIADIGVKVTAKDTIYYWHDAMKITKGLPAYVNIDPSYGFRAERRGKVISLGNKWSKPFFKRDVEEGKIKIEKPLITSPCMH